MKQFLSLIGYEYRMTVRRWGMWFAFGILFVVYGVSFYAPGEPLIDPAISLWQTAGQIVFRTNLFMPLVGGIIAADRLWRDYRLNIRELQRSAPIGGWTYLAAKYAGVVAGTLTPAAAFIGVVGVVSLFVHGAPPEFLLMLLVGFVALSVPAFAFVTIFSLACPLVMPVRVYQVLFTGYWFWGNFLSPKVIPTLSDTPLTPGGMWVFEGFFGGFTGSRASELASAGDAVLNLVVLASCIAAAFIALERYMAWQTQRV